MITRDNYEIYFMDYMDGVLPDEYEAELRAFLLVHSDLRELLEGMNEVRLQPGGDVFEKKRELKQQVNEKEMVYHAIAEAEGVTRTRKGDGWRRTWKGTSSSGKSRLSSRFG